MMAAGFWSHLVSNRRALFLSLAVAIILICFILGPLAEFIRFESLPPVFSHQQRIMHQTSANQTSPLTMESTSVGHVPGDSFIITNQNLSETLGIASQIIVLSLPRRADRRKQMEILRVTLGLRWTYVDALESTNAVVDNIITWVTLLRGRSTVIVSEDIVDTNVFRWPRNINALSSSSQPLGLEGSDLWTLPPRAEDTKVQLETAPGVIGRSSAIPTASTEPLTCAHEDNIILPFTPDLPEYQLLTPAKLACWNSHLSAIRRVAERGGKTHATEEQGVSVILEDDVDMEWDIRERLAGIWTSLPAGWDVVFLDKTGSNTSPAIEPVDIVRLHPAFGPKCTHAYALSRSGARRLLLHLRHPPFAYSRALDQAFAWLVQSGRIRAYSVVPSVVVQRKVGESDVMYGQEGMGSGWRERLVRGVFGT